MGYASTLEAIRERLDEALSVAKSLPDDPKLTTDAQRAGFERALSRLLQVVGEARSYLEIATDPTLDLAQKLSDAERDVKELTARACESMKTAVQLKQALDLERERSTSLAQKLEATKAELHRTEKALEKAYKDNPSGVLGAYSGGSVRRKDA